MPSLGSCSSAIEISNVSWRLYVIRSPASASASGSPRASLLIPSTNIRFSVSALFTLDLPPFLYSILSAKRYADHSNQRISLQPHFLITAIERKRCSLFSPRFEHMIEMSLLFIGNVSMGPNHMFSMACRIRAWSGH